MVRGCIAVFVLVWFYQYVSSHMIIKDSGLELQYTVTEYNHCLVDEFRLQLYIGRHLDDCIIACALRPHCQALTYLQFGSSSLCELYQKEGNVKRTGCVYIHKRNITHKKWPCNAECENGTTCNMKTKSCDYTECASLPNITNGKIHGNLRAVGKKIQFKCDIGKSKEREAVCQEDGNWSVSSVSCIKPEDCRDIHDIGIYYSGVYRIFPVGSGTEGINVRCDMNTPPGGWTIIQRRIAKTDFYKNWTTYINGFGDLFGSYWLGNDPIWKLTSNKRYRLRIDLTAKDGETRFAEYNNFSIENEDSKYALHIHGFNGTANDSLITQHNNMKFSTYDDDNDKDDDKNCANFYHGAWWYNKCHRTNLNGQYMNDTFGMGLTWKSWKGQNYSMKETEMKIYPADE